jgi:hypothetical protein
MTDKSDGVATLISEKTWRVLVRNWTAAKNKAKESAQECSTLVANAVEQHLHRGAFAAIMKLKRMEPAKAAEWLFHFDAYREREKLDHDDLLEDRRAAAAQDAPKGSEPPAASENADDPRPGFLKTKTAEAEAEAAEAKPDKVH